MTGMLIHFIFYTVRRPSSRRAVKMTTVAIAPIIAIGEMDGDEQADEDEDGGVECDGVVVAEGVPVEAVEQTGNGRNTFAVIPAERFVFTFASLYISA